MTSSPSGSSERGGRPPQVDALARSVAASSGLPHAICVQVARKAIESGAPDTAAARAEAFRRTLLHPVINATGVLLHTNLGRAPRSPDGGGGGQAVRYANLELDLATGKRADRRRHASALLSGLAGGEAGLIVNNGASAVLLVLAAEATGRAVIVSRGELVEIGGGFRIPEVMAASGARLVEVGTTNRTHLADYRRAVETHPDTALILKVHPSNYRVRGFTASVGVSELATIGPPVVVDLGSGLLDAATPWLPGGPPLWLHDEPAAKQTLAAGAAAVTFSGDKLLGGPQAGIIIGRRELVDRWARHPLSRALRAGGLVLEAMQRTALAYLERDLDELPFWRMATVEVGELRQRAELIGAGQVVDCESLPGAGSAPGVTIPSAGIALDGDHTERLRANDPPILARVTEDRTILDLRTVDPNDDIVIAEALRA